MPQFWLTIEGIRPSPSSSDVETVYKQYLTKDAPLRLLISDDQRNTMKRELQTDFAGSVQCLYKIQGDIFQRMEKDYFPHFKRSDFYFKYLNSCSNTTSEATQERRSMDEASIYRRTDNRAQTPRKSTSLERSTSARLAKSESWTTQGSMHPVAGWNTHVTESSNAKRDQAIDDPDSSSYMGRARGHVRAVSESRGSYGFPSLGKMLGSANEWWNVVLILQSAIIAAVQKRAGNVARCMNR